MEKIMKHIYYSFLIVIMGIFVFGCSTSSTPTQPEPQTEAASTITVTGVFTSIVFTDQSAIDTFGVIEDVTVKDKDGKTLETHTQFPASQALFDASSDYFIMKLSAIDASENQIFSFRYTNLYDVQNELRYGYHNPPSYLTEATYITSAGQLFKANPTITGASGILGLESFPSNELLNSFDDEGADPFAELNGSFTLTMVFQENVGTEDTTDKEDPAYKVSFTEDVVPSFQTMKCTDCHNAKDKFGNLVLEGDDVYNNVLKVIDKDTEENSLLLTKPLAESELTNEQLEESKQHPYKPFDSIEHSVYSMWKRWIEQGAKNN